MTHAPRGIETQIRMKNTGSFAEASGGSSWKNLNIYSEGFNPGEGVTDDPELGGNRHNLTDPLQGMPTRPQPTGALETAADLNQIGFLLSLLLGAPATDGAATPVYEHVWTSGKTAPGLAHFEMLQTAGIIKMADAFTASQLTLDLGDQDGYRRASWQMMGRSVRLLTTAVASSPAAAPARDKLLATKGLIKIGGVNLGNVLGGSFTLSNGAFTESYMDDTPWAGAVEIGAFSATLNPQIRFRSDHAALLASFDGVTPFAVQLLYQMTADRLLKIDLPNVIANRVIPQAGGVGMKDIQPTFLASQTPSAPMCTITVRNSIASYA